MAVYYWLYFAFMLSVNRNNLVIKQWQCDSGRNTTYSAIIRNEQQFKNYFFDNDLYCPEEFKNGDSFKFTDHTLLVQNAQPGNYCQIKNYTRLIYDPKNKEFVFSIVANGIGYCRKESVPQSIIISAKKISETALVKFRYKYISCDYGSELSFKEADQLLKSNDTLYDRVIVEY